MLNTLIFLSCACLLVSLIGLAMLCRVLIDTEAREREWQEMFASFLRDAAKHERNRLIENSGVFPRRN
jgi:hypothetical protein